MSIVLAVGIGLLYAAGTYLLLQRTLTRIILGLGLIGNGSVLVLLFGRPGGAPPFVGSTERGEPVADPLPQALSLTAIVITFGVLTFLLALAYRSWVLTENDEVEDDREDARLLGPHQATRVEIEQDALEQELEQT